MKLARVLLLSFCAFGFATSFAAGASERGDSTVSPKSPLTCANICAQQFRQCRARGTAPAVCDQAEMDCQDACNSH